MRSALLVAAILVILRSALFVVYPWSHFDSDQAIVGLMAKHLSEGRALPLYFYGQTFLLGVEAWLAVPWFWVFGPTATALKASMLASNLAVGLLLVVGLRRDDGLRPADAVAASIVFLLAAPLVAMRLMEAQGGNLEPLLFVVALWWLRRSPVWFGVVLALGFLTREFAIYAVPALIALSWWHGTLFRRETLIHWALVAASFVIVWDGVQMLEPYADLRGPGSRGSGRLVGDSQLSNLAARLAVSPGEIPERMATAVGDTLPRLLAGRSGGDDMTGRGRDWMGVLILTGLAVAVARSIRLRRAAPADAARASFGGYLLCVGAVAVLAFVVSRPVDNAPLRYALLALFLPIGITAVWLGVESDRRWRRAGLGVLGLWAALSIADHARMAAPFVAGREADPMGDVARALEAADVRIAEADYWRAYRLTFLTGERVIVASTDFIRIDEYQDQASAAGPDVGRLQDAPCDGGQPLATWYLCPR